MPVTVTNLFQDVIKSCRFHLGQAWWRKIQARTGFYGASPSNFSILLNEDLAEFLVFYYNDRFHPIRFNFLNRISDIFTC
jgi:hypothetical protein